MVEGSGGGAVTLHSPFSGYSTTIAVGHKSNAECQHEGAGCVFHHWNWGGQFLGEIAVAGCAVNDLTCKVDLTHNPYGFHANWAIVTVMLDDNNQGNLVAFVVTGQAPPPEKKTEASLSVTLTTSAQAGKFAVGDTASVTAKVTAEGGSVSSIALGLGARGSSVAITSQPSGAKSFSARQGSLTDLRVQVKATAKGRTTLVASADGKTSSDTTVRDSASSTVEVGGKALAISFETTPKKIALKVANDGGIVPGEVTVKVIVTNTSKTTIDGVQLLTLSVQPVDPTQQLKHLAFPSGTVPFRFAGSFAPGSHASRSFKLKVTGDGRYEMSALALYPDRSAPGGNGRVAGVGGEFEAVTPLLSFQADLHRDNISRRNGADWVKGGDSWYVGGRIKNLSSHQSLCLNPLFAQEDGNAISTGLQDVAQKNANVEEPPLAGLMKPGHRSRSGCSCARRAPAVREERSTSPSRPSRRSREPPARCRRTASSSERGCAHEGRDGDPGGLHLLHGSRRRLGQPGSDASHRVINFFGGFAKGSFDFYGGIVQSIGAVAKWAYNNPQTYLKLVRASLGDPTAQADLLSRMSEHMMAATTLIVKYLETVVPTTGEDPIQLAAQTWQHVGNDAYALIGKASAEWSKHWTDQLEHDYANGATPDLWRDYAGIAGEGLGQLQAIALQLFVEKLFAQMAATKASQFEAAANKATGAQKVITDSKAGVVAGRVLSVADKEQGWGITEAVAKKLREIAQKFDVLIGARSRQTISIELERLGAIWKNSNFHQKTVTALDRNSSGWTSRRGCSGSAASPRRAPPKAAAEIRAAGLSPTQEAEALARLAARIKENTNDFPHMEELLNWEHRACRTCPTEKGWVNAGFNASDSGGVASRTSTSRWRRFTMKETPIGPDGRYGTQYVPYEESPNLASLKKDAQLPKLCIRELGTVLCPITGDIDLVYITNKYGGSLTPEQMYDVFKALDDAGFAHTDLVTWVEQLTNNYYFPGKAGQLEGLVPGGEACVQFSKDGIERATYLAPLKQSIAIGPNNFQLSILGGAFPDMR